jgi:SagB-type dehydrogenase family enzyme
LHLSFGITAWKSFGPDRWAVRANPSSGNLHPVEAYLIVHDLPELAAGVYHYRPEDHALECRARFTGNAGSVWAPPAVCIALSTVMWREAWKYGERAFRYCQLDTGHAVAALHYAGAALGWRLSEQPQLGTESIARALGLDRTKDFPAIRHPETESEEAELLLTLSCGRSSYPAVDVEHLRRDAGCAQWSGVASTIDPRPMYRWPVLTDVAAATRVADGALAVPGRPWPDLDRWHLPETRASKSVAEVILGRRSAQRFDPRHWLDPNDFFGLLGAVMPPVSASRRFATHGIGFVLFVHRVSDLDPGVYLLAGKSHGTSSLAERLAADFDLGPVARAPTGLDFRLIAPVDTRPLSRLARGLHCHQEIAVQACFALGMVAEFDAVIDENPAAYRTVHRDAGALGHVLYLEAEARGLRGTGIGCFFDDALHELLKLTDTRFQTLYHFAVGRPIDDPRIEVTIPACPGTLPVAETTELA